MTKHIFLTILILMFVAYMGFTSCKGDAKNSVQADSLISDSGKIQPPDTMTNRLAMADSSWETAAKTYSKNAQIKPDTAAGGNKNPGIDKLGKPKIAPISKFDPNRPQELKDGLEKARKGDLRGAIADFDLAIAKNYKNHNAYFYKAKALIELNEPQNALPNLNLAIENYPINPLFFYYRGKLYFDQGKTENAFADFDKAVSLKADFADALNFRGVTRELKGQHNEAIEDYNAALKANPDFATAYYNKGTSEAALEKYNDALASFARCIELDPKNVMGFMNRGNCYVMLKQYKAAISDYTEVISIDPKNADAYFNRGAAYQYSGDKNSCKDWQKALSLGSKKASEVLNKYCK